MVLLVKAELYAFYSDSSIFQANRLLAKTINIGYAIEFGKTAGVKDSLFKQIGKLKEKGFTCSTSARKLVLRYGFF